MLPGELVNKQNMKFEMRIASLISAKKLSQYPGSIEKLNYLRKRTYNLANRDKKKENIKKNSAVTENIVPAFKKDLLTEEFKHLPLSQVLFTQKEQTVFYANAYQIPNFIV